MALAPHSDFETLIATWQALAPSLTLCNELQSVFLIHMRRTGNPPCEQPTETSEEALAWLVPIPFEQREESYPLPPPQRFMRRARSNTRKVPTGPSENFEPAFPVSAAISRPVGEECSHLAPAGPKDGQDSSQGICDEIDKT